MHHTFFSSDILCWCTKGKLFILHLWLNGTKSKNHLQCYLYFTIKNIFKLTLYTDNSYTFDSLCWWCSCADNMSANFGVTLSPQDICNHLKDWHFELRICDRNFVLLLFKKIIIIICKSCRGIRLLGKIQTETEKKVNFKCLKSLNHEQQHIEC